jgi:hypothetical protein
LDLSSHLLQQWLSGGFSIEALGASDSEQSVQMQRHLALQEFQLLA